MSTQIKFQPFLDECSSKEWISSKLNNGECDYWLVLQVITLEEDEREEGEDFRFARLYVVMPAQLTANTVKELCETNGETEEEWGKRSEEQKVGDIFEYGCRACVWEADPGTYLEMMMAAVRQASIVECMLGIFLDRPVNRLGTSGWKFLRGEYY